MIYYVYVLYDKISDKFYIGATCNLKRRLQEHNSGKVRTTKRMSELKFVYFEGCLNKHDAILRERQLKTGFGRGYLRKRLDNFLGV